MAGDETAFKVGDVVRLKSGGALMTVGSLREDGVVDVYFFDGAGESQWWRVPPAVLERVVPVGDAVAWRRLGVYWFGRQLAIEVSGLSAEEVDRLAARIEGSLAIVDPTAELDFGRLGIGKGEPCG